MPLDSSGNDSAVFESASNDQARLAACLAAAEQPAAESLARAQLAEECERSHQRWAQEIDLLHKPE